MPAETEDDRALLQASAALAELARLPPPTLKWAPGAPRQRHVSAMSARPMGATSARPAVAMPVRHVGGPSSAPERVQEPGLRLPVVKVSPVKILPGKQSFLCCP